MPSELIGNSDITERLRSMLSYGRFPQSLLFSGPQGVGKRSLAERLARALVCTSISDGVACGECGACVRASQIEIPPATENRRDDFKQVFFSSHPDVGFVVPYNRNIYVDAMRDLEREANFRPYEADARIFIIDDADKMNDNAANALLKTLEEPPATTHIILVTSRPDSLLPTIRSRCQNIRFSPVPANEIAKYLQEEKNLPEDEANLISKLADGSVGKALSLDLSTFHERRDLAFAIVRDAISGGRIGELLVASETLNDAKNKENYEENLDLIEDLIRDVRMLKIAGAAADHVKHFDLAGDLRRLASIADSRRLGEALAAIEELRRGLNVNINRRAATDSLFLSIAS